MIRDLARRPRAAPDLYSHLSVSADVTTIARMQLLDDALFNLWKNGLCEEEDVVLKSNQPGELKARITRAKKGLLDEEPEDEDEDGEEE